MSFPYSFALRLYYTGASIFAVFSKKAALWVRGQKDIWKGLPTIADGQKVFWMHCSSVGEFEQGRPLLEQFKTQFPDWKIVLTFFSPSGYELRKNYSLADYVNYLPLDSSVNAKKFVAAIRPNLVVFVKYDFWYFYFQELHRRDVPLYMVSVKLHPGQPFFKWYGAWFRKILKLPEYWFLQDEGSAELLRKNGQDNCLVTGDTRYDRVMAIANTVKPIERIQKFCAGGDVLVIGSNWKKDDEFLLPVLKKELLDWKIIVVPHEMDPSQLSAWRNSFPDKTACWTKPTVGEEEKKVFLVDTVGMLSSIYQYARIAYVGGGFGAGIHNILEAGVYGVPVVFGPNHRKFNEAADFLKRGFAISVDNAEQLAAALAGFAKRTGPGEESNGLKQAMKRFFEGSAGATTKIMNVLEEKAKQMHI